MGFNVKTSDAMITSVQTKEALVKLARAKHFSETGHLNVKTDNTTVGGNLNKQVHFRLLRTIYIAGKAKN